MKLCLHRRGAQPRRKKIKAKQPPRVLTFRERMDLEKAQRVARAQRQLPTLMDGPALAMAAAGVLFGRSLR